MNREIKFRVWDGKSIQYLKDEMFWLLGKSGYFELQDHCAEYFNTIESYNGHKDLSILNKADNQEAVLMQYTGLKDKNSKEIYEGDIIESPLKNVVEVFWGTKDYQIKGFPKNLSDLTVTGWLVRNSKGVTDVLDETFAAGKVIGNIYENPELLTEPDTANSDEGKSDTATAPKEN